MDREFWILIGWPMSSLMRNAAGTLHSLGWWHGDSFSLSSSLFCIHLSFSRMDKNWISLVLTQLGLFTSLSLIVSIESSARLYSSMHFTVGFILISVLIEQVSISCSTFNKHYESAPFQTCIHSLTIRL